RRQQPGGGGQEVRPELLAAGRAEHAHAHDLPGGDPQSQPREAVSRAALPLLLLLGLTGCVRGCTSSSPPVHLNPNMDWQPKVQAQEASDFFYDGSAMRPPIPGTV